MSTLEIVAVLISVIGVTLTVLRNMWCWWFNFIAFLLYGYLFYTYKLYGETILQAFFVVVNFYGFYYWLKGKQTDHDIRIEPLAPQTALFQMLIAAVVGLSFGLILKHFTDAAVPMLDAQLAAFSLSATYWTTVNILPPGCCGWWLILFMWGCLFIKRCFLLRCFMLLLWDSLLLVGGNGSA